MGFWLLLFILLVVCAIATFLALKKGKVLNKPQGKETVEETIINQPNEQKQKAVIREKARITEVRRTAENKREIDKRKGDIGEYTINVQLDGMSKEYKHLPDLMLKVDDKTTQIDHLVVSPYGIFVIETKNRKGWIYGSENYKVWTQTLNKHSKYTFANPIWQNNYHIKAVKQNLSEYKTAKYYSIITFTRNAVLKKIPKSTDGSYYVVFNTDVADTIGVKRGNKVLKEDEVEKIFNKLKQLNITDPKLRNKHNKKL